MWGYVCRSINFFIPLTWEQQDIILSINTHYIIIGYEISINAEQHWLLIQGNQVMEHLDKYNLGNDIKRHLITTDCFFYRL